MKGEEMYGGEHEESLLSSNIAMSDIGYEAPKRESGQIYEKIQALENLFSEKGKGTSGQSGRASYGKQFLMKKTGNRLVKAMGALSARTPALRNARKWQLEYFYFIQNFINKPVPLSPPATSLLHFFLPLVILRYFQTVHWTRHISSKSKLTILSVQIVNENIPVATTYNS